MGDKPSWRYGFLMGYITGYGLLGIITRPDWWLLVAFIFSTAALIALFLGLGVADE